MVREELPLIPGFRVLRRLGSGASGSVYQAIAQDTEREVALKLFEPADDPEAATPAEIEHEREVAARLRHRNLARILAVGAHGDRRWLASEYLAGGDLTARIAARMRVADALAVVGDVARGLGHAHARGVVHGDVKPANILFRGSGEAVLVDFGIAALAREGESRATMQGGTPDYMSPEQSRGEPVDGRTDFYSLGVVLHEMLVGRLPWPSGARAEFIERGEGAPRLPARHQWIQPLLDALLAENPDDRPRDARALLALLSSVCACAPEADAVAPFVATSESGRVRGRHEVEAVRRARRRRITARLTLILTGLVILALTTFWLVRDRI